MTDHPTGSVVLVGTPIGNLGDLTPRAAAVLASADLVLCEDTRRTRALLSAAGITGTRLVAFHARNEAAVTARAVAEAAAGATVAVVSDAGMPGISDPGERLVVAAAAAGVAVTTAPGPTAAVSALVLSGLPAGRWCMEGFLPRKGAERRARLAAVAADERTTVIYEAPHRMARTVADLAGAAGGDRPVALVRELTKRFEEVWRGDLTGAAERLETGEVRGEWVLVLGGAAPRDVTDADILGRLADLQATGLDRRAAVAEVAGRFGVGRSRVYDLELGARPDPAPPRAGGPAATGGPGKAPAPPAESP